MMLSKIRRLWTTRRGCREVQAGVSMTGSLGTLMTFTLSDNVRLEVADVEVTPQTDTTNLAFVQEIRNVGSEPALDLPPQNSPV